MAFVLLMLVLWETFLPCAFTHLTGRRIVLMKQSFLDNQDAVQTGMKIEILRQGKILKYFSC